jgi:hypothetical protein
LKGRRHVVRIYSSARRLLPDLSSHGNCEQIGNMSLCSDVFSPERQLRRRTCRMTNRC